MLFVFPHGVWYLLCHRLHSMLYSRHFPAEQQLERIIGKGAVGVSIGDVAVFQDVEKEVFLYF